MKSVTDFLPRIIPYVQGCPEPMATRALVDAAISFCEESLVIRENLDPFSTVATYNAYDLDNPQGQQVARVLNVWVDGSIIDPVPADRLPEVSTTSGSGKPSGYYTTRTDSQLQLCLTPTPDRVYSIVAEVALRPVRDTNILQDDLYNLWIETLVSGALHRLMRTPAQPFSDPVKAAEHGIMAVTGARKARVESGFGRVKSSVRVFPRSFT